VVLLEMGGSLKEELESSLKNRIQGLDIKERERGAQSLNLRERLAFC
jgi:hypothetical protein